MEYCETETFEAHCPEGQMIYMRSAQYGRMKFGRCVDRDYGYIGCKNDVLELADRLCSGRPKCQIPIPNSMFKRTKPCPKDLKPYFEASYGCLAVEHASGQNCESSTFVLPSSSVGYIANHITLETKKGSADCPWMIQAMPGQRVNITLIDFARTSGVESNSVSDEYDICHVYAVVRERQKTRGVTICGGKERERHVYTSIGNSVEIRILGGKLGHEAEYFMLQYEVSGCQDPMLPKHTWMKRDMDSALIGCPETGQTWRLECVANEWEGEIGNCTGIDPSFGEMIWSSVFIPFEVSLVIVIAIAVGIGVIVLAIGLICMQGRKKKLLAAMANTKPVGHVPPNVHLDKHDPPGLPPPPEFLMNENEGVVMENEYAYIEEMPPPPPSPSPPPPAPPLSAPPYPMPNASPKCQAPKASSRDPLMASHDQLHLRDTCSATSSPRHQSTAFPFPPPPAEVLANPSFVASPAHAPRNAVLPEPRDTCTASRYGAIRVKEVAPYSIRTCHGLQHPDANGNSNFTSSAHSSPRLHRTPSAAGSGSPANGNSPYHCTRNCDTMSIVSYSEVPAFYEVEPDEVPGDAVPYEYGYSCKTGEKFTVYHAKSLGKHGRGGNNKKHKFITKKKKSSKTGTM